mgnify:CR=1 FL=1
MEQQRQQQYDGSEMDEVISPPLRMIGLFIGLTAIAFVYVFVWSVLLRP